MNSTVIQCALIIKGAIWFHNENNWPVHERFEAYKAVWLRAYDLEGHAPQAAPSNRLICLTSRLADILS